MQTDDLYNTRLERILKAVALETPDRVPVVLEYSGFAAYVTGTRMADFLRSPVTNLEAMIQAFDAVGRSLPRELRCTALGGLSITKAAKGIEARLATQ